MGVYSTHCSHDVLLDIELLQENRAKEGLVFRAVFLGPDIMIGNTFDCCMNVTCTKCTSMYT